MAPLGTNALLPSSASAPIEAIGGAPDHLVKAAACGVAAGAVAFAVGKLCSPFSNKNDWLRCVAELPTPENDDLERVFARHTTEGHTPVCVRIQGQTSIVLSDSEDIKLVLASKSQHFHPNPKDVGTFQQPASEEQISGKPPSIASQTAKLVRILEQNVVEDDIFGCLRKTSTSVEASSSTAWLLMYLSTHPEWEHKCRKEARKVLNGRGETSLSSSDLEQLPLLQACVLEALRLSPAVPSLSLVCDSSSFTLRGLPVPPGSVVHLLLRHAQTATSGVSDPFEWRPERWLEQDSAGGVAVKPQECVTPVFALAGPDPSCEPGQYPPGRASEVMAVMAGLLTAFPRWQMLQKEAQVRRFSLNDGVVTPRPLGFRFLRDQGSVSGPWVAG